MAKRVSVKGKGADIFFGDYPPAPSPSGTSNGEGTVVGAITPAAARNPESESTGQQTTEPSMQESKKARMPARKQAVAPWPQPSVSTPDHPFSVQVLNSIWQSVSHQATITNAFRYTEEELSALADALYEVTKRHGVKLSKQDIARLGLNAVLSEYRARGDASLLGEYALRKKQQS